MARKTARKPKAKAKPKAAPKPKPAKAAAQAEKVIPLSMIPDKGFAVEKSKDDGKDYLVVNEAMYTFYRRTRGELSPYFLGILQKKLYGARCPKCGAVRVPPFMLRCTDCNFTEMQIVEVPDRGRMLHSPPITYFAHSIFQDIAPFGRGRVVLGNSITACPMLVYTTKGVLRPGIFKKGTPVKVVFRSKRSGSPRDVFAVPQSELTKEQLEKPGLEETDLDWDSPAEPAVAKPTPRTQAAFESLLKNLESLDKRVKKSYRAQKDLAGWKRKIQVKTAGGNFFCVIKEGGIEFKKGSIPGPELTMITEDPDLFQKWMDSREALTNAIIAGQLWISRNSEFKTVFKLDRLPRSLRRT
jgi:uncharacterized OB-fold protein